MRFLRSPHGPGSVLLDAMGQSFVQEGVLDSAHGVLSRLAANTIRVAPGKGWIDGDAVAGIGSGRIYVEWAQTDVNVPNAGAGLQRIDQLIVRLTGGHGSQGAVERVAGASENAGHTLDSGAAYGALPPGAMRVGAVRSGAAGVAGTGAADMRDRRPWARGLRNRLMAVSPGITIATSPAVTSISPGGPRRVECSGAIMSVRCTTLIVAPASTLNWAALILFVDGVQRSDVPGYSGYSNGVGGTPVVHGTTEFPFVPTPGSHVFEIFSQGNGSPTISAGVQTVLVFEELLGANSDNGAA